MKSWILPREARIEDFSEKYRIVRFEGGRIEEAGMVDSKMVDSMERVEDWPNVMSGWRVGRERELDHHSLITLRNGRGCRVQRITRSLYARRTGEKIARRSFRLAHIVDVATPVADSSYVTRAVARPTSRPLSPSPTPSPSKITATMLLLQLNLPPQPFARFTSFSPPFISLPPLELACCSVFSFSFFLAPILHIYIYSFYSLLHHPRLHPHLSSSSLPSSLLFHHRPPLLRLLYNLLILLPRLLLSVLLLLLLLLFLFLAPFF